MQINRLFNNKSKKFYRSFSVWLIIVACFFAFSHIAHADYTFPGALPPGCSGSGGNYTCGSLTANTRYHFNDSGIVTVTVNGSFTINNYTIGDSSDNAYVNFNVNGTVTISSPTVYANINANSYAINVNGAPSIYGDLRTSTGNISARGAITGNIITERGDIVINASSQVNGDVAITGSTTTAHLDIYQDCVINGYISVKTATTTDDIDIRILERTVVNGSVFALGQDYTDVLVNYDAIINGDIFAHGDDHSDVFVWDRAQVHGNIRSNSVDVDDGDVEIKSNASVSGYISAFGDIYNYGSITGCAYSSYTSGTNVRLYSGSSNSGGSCCGSRNSCSSSCIDNASGSPTTLCSTTDTITVNAYGSDYFGSWPVMELWVNQVKVDSVMVDSSTAKNYVFYANLPTSGSYKIDLVFPNDLWNYASEDRNLIINSINYRGNTVLSTDASVTRDYGSSSSTYFDGLNTAGPGADLNSAGAMRFSHSVDATLIAEYHMDETSWNGSANDIIDTAGYTGGPFNGQGIGSPIPTPAITSPARAGATGTCGYSTFSGPRDGGSAFSIPNLAVNTASGAKTSVSFWMYWDGTDYLMPLGWFRYDLWFVNGWFGFNTDNSDNFGTSASGLANGWHHIVAVFNNGDVTKSKLYIDGSLKTLSSYNSHNNANAFVQSTLQVTGYAKNHNFRFPGGRIDEVKVYQGELSTAQVSADYNATHACDNSFKLLQYHMDETSWSGAADEVIDSSGLNIHGTAAIKSGTVYPTTANSNRAISGTTGTCGYGNFNGQQYVDVKSSFLNLTDSYTIATWIKPSNINAIGQRIFADDQNNNGGYSLSLSDGGGQEGKINFFKRNSSGITSSIFSDYRLQNNLWYYIAASVSTKNNKVTLYIYDQAGTLLENKTGNFDYLSFTDGGKASIANENTASSESKGFYGDLDELQVYYGSRPLYQSEILALKNETHSCPSYVLNADANGFACVSLEEPDNNTGHLYMQPRNTYFGVKVIALKADGTPETSFSTVSDKNVTLAFIDQTNSNTAIQFRDNLTDVYSKTVTFPSGDNTGIVSVNNLRIIPAYRNLKCQITDANQTPTVTSQSTDNFSVRPTNVSTVKSTNATADIASGSNAAGTPIVVAGADFQIAASPGVYNYNGTFKIDHSKLVPHASAVQSGTLTGSFTQASPTAYGWSQSTFQYDEVGYFKLSPYGVYDDDFTTVDSANGDCTNDFSNTKVNGKYGCKFGNAADSEYMGRFIPYHFDVGGGSRVTTGQCSSTFTYYGQDGLTTNFEIRAENLAGTLVRNYDGAYAKLDLNTWTDTSASTGLRFLATNLPSGVTLLASATATTGSWTEGLGSVVAKHQLSRPSTETAPVNLAMEMDAIDSDGVGVDDGTPESINLSANALFHYGRLTVANAYGSELYPAKVPMQAQYWDGTGWVQETQDNCSIIQPINVTLFNYEQNLNACEATLTGGGTMSSGELAITITAPGNGNNGSMNLSPNLSSASGTTCVPTAVSATSANTSWFGTSPVTKATFGIFKSPVIFMRENY